jgi:hypothetical protein
MAMDGKSRDRFMMSNDVNPNVPRALSPDQDVTFHQLWASRHNATERFSPSARFHHSG